MIDVWVLDKFHTYCLQRRDVQKQRGFDPAVGHFCYEPPKIVPARLTLLCAQIV